mmetsp:Transcript_22211/g.3692  ORF Transcript_22211/g.3692 Transcript_22211/m.3692 type:complete len:102 (+) Transcript_22211:57-362(+)
MFSIANYFRKNLPTSTNLVKISKNLNIEDSTECVRREWKKQLEKKNPSLAYALFNAFKGYTILTIIFMGFLQNAYAISPIYVKFLIDYLEDDDADTWVGVV